MSNPKERLQNMQHFQRAHSGAHQAATPSEAPAPSSRGRSFSRAVKAGVISGLRTQERILQDLFSEKGLRPESILHLAEAAKECNKLSTSMMDLYIERQFPSGERSIEVSPAPVQASTPSAGNPAFPNGAPTLGEDEDDLPLIERKVEHVPNPRSS